MLFLSIFWLIQYHRLTCRFTRAAGFSNIATKLELSTSANAQGQHRFLHGQFTFGVMMVIPFEFLHLKLMWKSFDTPELLRQHLHLLGKTPLLLLNSCPFVFQVMHITFGRTHLCVTRELSEL